jgi:hypothetical protein
MKKIILFFVATTFLCATNYAQTVKASLGPSDSANKVSIYLLPDATQSMPTIGTLQFNVGVPVAGTTTPPVVTIASHVFGSGVTWNVSPPFVEEGFWNYNIYTVTSPLTTISFTSGVEAPVITLRFTSGTPTLGPVSLVTLPDGGSNQQLLFLCTGSIISNGLGNLYYARNGTTVNNQNSYDPSFAQPGVALSSVTIPNIVLPVKFLDFTATKNNNSALLSWLVENEDVNTALYEVEISTTGADFRKAATLQPLNNGRSSNSYSFTQDNLSGIRNNGIIYFRIKQIDKDGKFVYSDIRNVRISGRGIVFGVYPNPVKQSATVSFDLENSEKISFVLTDATGKQVWGNQLQGVKGANFTSINMAKFAAGTYNLKLQTATESKVIAVVKAD